MKWLSKYLENRKQEKERRKQEEFLNKRVPLNKLYICYMCSCSNSEYIRFLLKENTYTFDSIKILKKQKDNEFSYIDPITKEKYRIKSHYNVKLGDVAVSQTKTVKFSEKILKRQYIKIAELIELNEKLNSEIKVVQ